MLLAAGLAAQALESALLAHFPLAAVPSLSLLFPIAAALLLGPLAGLLVAAALGFGADVLSGALFGQHAFLRLGEFVAVRALTGQFDLVRPLPFASFALAIAVADTVGSALLVRFFLGSFDLDPNAGVMIALRTLTTAVAAPLVLMLTRRVVVWGSGDLDPRREMRLETRRPVL